MEERMLHCKMFQYGIVSRDLLRYGFARRAVVGMLRDIAKSPLSKLFLLAFVLTKQQNKSIINTKKATVLPRCTPWLTARQNGETY
jgi:hypothetical protein